MNESIHCITIIIVWMGEGLWCLTYLMLPQDGHILLCCQVEVLILVETRFDLNHLDNRRLVTSSAPQYKHAHISGEDMI